MLQGIDLSGKVVLVRVDYNVPLNKNHEITDTTRIDGSIPTINNLVERGAKIILMSHLGRPQKKKLPSGKIDRESFSTVYLIPQLEQTFGKKVNFVDDSIGPKVQSKIADLKSGEILLLENTRFYAGEEKGDRAYAQSLSELADFYINDAFGAAHRAHSSTSVIAEFFDHANRDFGKLMISEIKNAEKVLNNAESPFVAIVGGAKVSDKILLIEKLLQTADDLIIGGGMAYTFIRAKGGKTGNSLVEEDKIDLAADLLRKAKSLGKIIHLPVDSIVADAFAEDAHHKEAPSDEIEDNWMGLDIGPKATKEFGSVIQNAKTILWNGPMGVFEMKAFAGGTKTIASYIAKATNNGAYSLVGGGDSVSAINQTGLASQISFISTGGGAMLEFLEGKELPGIAAIKSH